MNPRVFIKASAITFMLLALAGCANSLKTGTTPTVTPSASPSASPSTSVTPASLLCTSSQLAIEPGSGGVAMGTVGVTGMGLKNISTATCKLKGYPVLQMLDSTGRSIPTYVSHGKSFGVPASPAKFVILAPGLVAKFDILYHNQTGYGTAICPTSTQVEITPPGANKPITFPWKIQPYGGSTIQKLQCGDITVSPVYAP
jgi:hypothetical protein